MMDLLIPVITIVDVRVHHAGSDIEEEGKLNHTTYKQRRG